MIPCTECDKNGSGFGQYQAVDEYPADDVEADRENSAHSGHLSLMQSDDMTQSFNGYSEMSSSVCPKTESGLFEEHAYEKQRCELSTSRVTADPCFFHQFISNTRLIWTTWDMHFHLP